MHASPNASERVNEQAGKRAHAPSHDTRERASSHPAWLSGRPASPPACLASKPARLPAGRKRGRSELFVRVAGAETVGAAVRGGAASRLLAALGPAPAAVAAVRARVVVGAALLGADTSVPGLLGNLLELLLALGPGLLVAAAARRADGVAAGTTRALHPSHGGAGRHGCGGQCGEEQAGGRHRHLRAERAAEEGGIGGWKSALEPTCLP
mmetsp:Transcript_141412/g.439515  ORF Transcript_141412/g.439515 Transcript_141412/m.439515 type:complete len:210 (-) Transcript_141412:17-646(-)